ncbi:hypothetical protein [Paraburkholderia phenazinium]|uniref:Uncharacterized protein n=1 Tax=Paraburkholderia phenazinium TaxID=60549 RepID=A0A1G7TPU7_9BURK|nr:hypothetical protein [Paraburkholderia phenazinium]SDG36530.1 hypothetical protein SAMN05216466_10386 [Paraburkholderia phenazinium]
MYNYIIAAHGGADYSQSTDVLPSVTVAFYQPFGVTMDNQVGLDLQSAIANPEHPNAANVIHHNREKARWMGHQQGHSFPPGLNLSGEARTFKSGIVCANTHEVVMSLPPTTLITLSYAIRLIRSHADQTFTPGCSVLVHCLFCL